MQAVLTERECEVLKLRLTDNLTLKQIGQRLGIISERVRQIETRALRKLQRVRVQPPVSN
jgi:RNA polymerase sigma factor (sigma-70 family)